MYSTLMHTVLVYNSEHQGNIWALGEEVAWGEQLSAQSLPLLGHQLFWPL